MNEQQKNINYFSQLDDDQELCKNIFSTILEIAHDAIIGLDSDQNINLFNIGAENIFGYLAEEVIGKPIAILLPPYLREKHRSHITKFSKTDVHSKAMGERKEVVGQRKDGTTFPASASIAKAVQDGNLIFSVILRDITEQKKIEQELRKRKDRLENIIEGTHVGTWEWNIKTGEIIYNERWAEMIGYTLEELSPITQNTWPDFVHPDDLERVRESMDMHFAFKTDFFESEYRMKHKDGHWVWILDHGKVANFTPDGEPLLFYGIHFDITDRKKIEEALFTSERYLNHLLNATPSITYTLKYDGNNMMPNWVSDNLTRILGYKQEEIYAPNWWRNNIHPDEKQKVIEKRKSIFTEGYDLQEYRFRHKDGHFIWQRDEVTLFRDAKNKPLEIIGTWINVTDRKETDIQIKTQLQRVETLNSIQLAMVSSFDVRLTLNAIIEAAINELNVDAGSVLLLNPYSNTLEYAVGKGFKIGQNQEGSLNLGEGIAGRVALDRKRLYIPDLLKSKYQFIRSQSINEEGFITYIAEPLIAKGKVKGILEIFNRSRLEPDDQFSSFFKTIAGQAAVAIDNAQSFEELQRSNINLSLAYDKTIEGWSHAMDLRDKETEGHTQRVTELTVQLSRAMGVSEEQIVHIRRGALLHDMGKLGIPDDILHKPGKLTKEEWVIMKQHPQFAYDMLSAIDYLRPALDIPYCHHEKWDGTGYPRGLKGEQIPLAARIFAVIDVWDALTSDRPYRAAWSHEKTMAYIRDLSGTHFDPKVVDLFMNVMTEKDTQGNLVVKGWTS